MKKTWAVTGLRLHRLHLVLLVFALVPAVAATQSATDSLDPIPGPRDCFWARGPHSADPYINLAYPDANVFYWAAAFTIPQGTRFSIEGHYPHSRYMSFISYDERGRPIESLADYLIESDSHNPFISENPRDNGNREYKIDILNAHPTSDRQVGEILNMDSNNVLHAPAYGAGQQVILYRIYLPDEGKAPGGGVNLPSPVLILEDGTELRGSDACETLQTDQQVAITIDALGIPTQQYRELISQPNKADTWPAHNPPEWFIQLDRQSLIGMYAGDIDPDAPRSEGGFYPNLDNHYIRTIVNRKHGKVLLIRGMAPTTPKTYHGETPMGAGELRYWSVCSNQSFVNTRVNDCVFDEEIPVSVDGLYTIAISRSEDRPRNAIKKCGIAWLPMARDGDGMFDPDVTIVQIRHMLSAPDFDYSIQRVHKQSDLESTMGPYMPRSRYLMPNQVETIFPCLLNTAQ